MGAQPKNKITRVERGKRRAGNTPGLKKDPKVSKTPLHKKSLMAKFDKILGAKSAAAKAAAPVKKAVPTSEAAKTGVKASAAPAKVKTTKGATVKATKRTPVNRGK